LHNELVDQMVNGLVPRQTQDARYVNYIEDSKYLNG